MPQQPTAENGDQIASPISTGGGGTIFELKVQTGLVAALLVRAYVPVFNNATIQELHLQSEHLGYASDDALVIALDHTGRQRRQLWSIKREVKLTESDDVFGDVIADAWKDFADTKIFDSAQDAIILATGPLAAATYKHLLTLLEFARAASTAESFFGRIGRKGFTSEKSKEYLGVVRQRCDDAAARTISDDECWRFLRCFHILSHDFAQTASQDEAHCKTMLAIAAREKGGKTGEDLWNAIFTWVADQNPHAGSFTINDLPDEWREATNGIGTHFESGVIHRLTEHGEDLLKRIRTTLGPHLHLERQDLTERLATAFVSEQFTLVTGQAGVGKSAAALSALRDVLDGAPLFVFQATEFARDHLDHALSDLRVTEPLSTISSLFALHSRKFVLIESVERLLESTEREAFFMLLERLNTDPTWRVILTCRQHAAPMVKDAFLTPQNLRYDEVIIPPLNDQELDHVFTTVPGLDALASNPRTRDLLRNPFLLDKACSIDWSREAKSEPLDQRRLREVLWRQVIVRDHVRAGGIHLQRDRYFRDIALRRARSLKSFVSILPGEEAAVTALVADELLVEEPRTRQVAPAHDVLEDWALVRWVAATFEEHGTDPKRFFDALGHELPIRRSYRQWLQELLATDDIAPVTAFVDAVLTHPGMEPYWRDETYVSVLLSNEAPRFLQSHETALLAHDKRELHTVIHLLRVACKKPNPLWGLSEGDLGKAFGDTHLVPEGSAWGALLRLIHRNLQHFAENDLPLVLGMLEDWKASINWQTPTADAAREAGLITLHYWNSVEDRPEKTFERLASILLAAPQDIAPELCALLTMAAQPHRRQDRAEILGKKVLATFDGFAACRFLPDAVATFAKTLWGIDRPMPTGSPYGGYRLDMDEYFGLSAGNHLEYFPPSALQGPFKALLQWKPLVGIDLILALVNVTTERYVTIGLDEQYNNGPITVTVDLGAGENISQWANQRLWMMYRGGMPAPELVVSALMALEQRLLHAAEAGQDLEQVTRSLIQGSQSVSITAVVASVAMAHPAKVGKTALALLRTPELYDLDLARYVHDQHPIGSMFAGLGTAMQRIHYQEIAKNDKLPHRAINLESLALNLQTGPLRADVWTIIDTFKAQLPPSEEQGAHDKLWRLRLHRMDLRNFAPTEQLPDGRILIQPGPPDDDVAEFIKESAPAMEANTAAISLQAWGLGAFDHNETSDPSRWHEMLTKAQCTPPEAQEEFTLATQDSGRAYVAAVCVRDHWTELTSDEKRWCTDFLLAKIAEENETTDYLMRMQRFAMAGSRAAAQVLPLLLDNTDEQERVRNAIASALTHAIEEVQQFAAVAVGMYLWERDAVLASACVAGLLDLAQLERRCYGTWSQQPYETRGKFYDTVSRRIEEVRARIVSGKPLEVRVHYRMSLADSFSARLMPSILNTVARQYHRQLAQNLFRQVAETIVHGEQRRRRYRERRNYEAESTVKTQFADYIVQCDPAVAVRLWEPFANAVRKDPDVVAKVFQRLIGAEDRARKGAAFWAIWQETKERLLQVPDLHRLLTHEHSDFADLGSTLLLDLVRWKQDAKDWDPLHGHQTQLLELFGTIGTAPQICYSFLRLLDSVGSSLLPDALTLLDDRLQHGDRQAMIGTRDALFTLTCILTPLVFGQTSILRKSPVLRDAALRVLDAMVASGSSAGYRMREFLITPIRQEHLQ
jgi:hypothetical protein